MEPSRSSDSVRTRLQLAQLLRRLRAIRKDQQSDKTQAERVELALAEAEGLGRFITTDPTGPDGRYHAGPTRLDRRKLSEAGLAQRRGERVQEPRSPIDCR
jgi:hypothetical protein